MDDDVIGSTRALILERLRHSAEERDGYAAMLGGRLLVGAQCSLCREEAQWVAQEEHPAWFDEAEEVREEHVGDLDRFADERTPRRPCVGFFERGARDPHTTFCADHLRFVASALDLEAAAGAAGPATGPAL